MMHVKKILSQETKSKGKVLGKEIGSLLSPFLSSLSVFMWCPPINVCVRVTQNWLFVLNFTTLSALPLS